MLAKCGVKMKTAWKNLPLSGDNTEKVWVHRFFAKQKSKAAGDLGPKKFSVFWWKNKKNSVCKHESTTKDNTAIVFFELLSTFETCYSYVLYRYVENPTQTRSKKSEYAK